jgi:hypothetical protein
MPPEKEPSCVVCGYESGHRESCPGYWPEPASGAICESCGSDTRSVRLPLVRMLGYFQEATKQVTCDDKWHDAS